LFGNGVSPRFSNGAENLEEDDTSEQDSKRVIVLEKPMSGRKKIALTIVALFVESSHLSKGGT